MICGYYSRAATIKPSGIRKNPFVNNYKGFEKSQFYKINKELRYSHFNLKQNLQLLKATPWKQIRRDTATLATATD